MMLELIPRVVVKCHIYDGYICVKDIADMLMLIFFRCSSFNPSSLDASSMDAFDHRINNSAEDQLDQVNQAVDQVDQADPVNAVDPVNQVDQVDPANRADPADQVDQVDRVGQNDEALRKMKQPVQSSEEANVDHCEDDATENAIDGNAPVAVEDVLVELDKDAKESKTDAKTEVQYNAKENTAKDVETSRTEENEKHVEKNAKRDFEKVDEVAEKDFEKVDEVAKKVADGMVIEVIVNI